MDKIRIIAFGDSLTVGFQSPTMERPWYEETPYARFLLERLRDRADIIVQGINGELTEEMLRRFDDDVIHKTPNYVIILGGTNDIGWGIQADQIMGNLESMYRLSVSENIIPVAVTIPSIRGVPSLIPPRQRLNNMIIEASKTLKIPWVDMFTASSEKKSLHLAQEYSNDGIHLTTDGYRLLAELIYEKVFCNI